MTLPDPPKESDLILAVTDIAGFARAAKPKPSLQIFELLAEFYDLVGTIIGAAGGRVIKFIGDASLIAFPSDTPQQAVSALRTLQARAGGLLARFGPDCRISVRLHVGKVACGFLGTETDKRFDISGEPVNELFLTPGAEFTISPELQQLLDRHDA